MTGRELRALRNALGLTQEEMGKILDVTRVTIVNAEKDGPSKALISYIDRALSRGLLKISERKSKPETDK